MGHITLEERVELHVIKDQVKAEGSFTLEEGDGDGWDRVYELVTGNRNYPPTSNNKYWRRHFGKYNQREDSIHPFDTLTEHGHLLTINNMTEMLQLLRSMTMDEFGMYFAYVPTFITSNNVNILDRSTLLPEWEELLRRIIDMKSNSNRRVNDAYILQHFHNNAGLVLSNRSKHVEELLQNKMSGERLIGCPSQWFRNIFQKAGSIGGFINEPVTSFPDDKTIVDDFCRRLGEDPVLAGAFMANGRLNNAQVELVMQVTNNLRPPSELVSAVDHHWAESANPEIRDYRMEMIHRRYVLSEGLEGGEKFLFLSQFQLHHNSPEAVAQKRKDNEELGRSQPSELYSHELGPRRHMLTMLPITDHAVETHGDPDTYEFTSGSRSRVMLYNALGTFENTIFGAGCVVSGEVMSPPYADMHHNAAKRDIREKTPEGDTVVYPTDKVCNRDGLYLCKADYIPWSDKVFWETVKRNKWKKEWHVLLHWVLNNLAWFESKGYEIDYPYSYEESEDGKQLVRTRQVTPDEQAAAEERVAQIVALASPHSMAAPMPHGAGDEEEPEVMNNRDNEEENGVVVREDENTPANQNNDVASSVKSKKSKRKTSPDETNTQRDKRNKTSTSQTKPTRQAANNERNASVSVQQGDLVDCDKLQVGDAVFVRYGHPWVRGIVGRSPNSGIPTITILACTVLDTDLTLPLLRFWRSTRAVEHR